MGLKSFVEVPVNSHFSLENLPFGIFRPKNVTGESTPQPRPAVAIGELVLDLSVIATAGLFNGRVLSNNHHCFLQASLNMLLEMGRPAWKEARLTIQKLLSADEPTLRDNASLRGKSLIPMSDVEMLLPVVIGDFTDFSCSFHHFSNCLNIINGSKELPKNWFHLPIAYHGRASSIVVSGTDIVRPRGQSKPITSSSPEFGPTRKLDFELEMAAIIGPGNEQGKHIDVNNAADHIFGLVLMNDWSARDMLPWEFIPLGPFLGKSFATTISPWIVTLDALEPFICDAPKQEPQPLPYLAETKHANYDIPMEVWIKPKGDENAAIVSRSNLNHLYWTINQQLAHHTINGCNLRTGDVLGTGGLSGPDPGSYGCMLELSSDGENPVTINSSSREFLEDGDEVIFTACCKGEDFNVGFGVCTGKVLPSIP